MATANATLVHYTIDTKASRFTVQAFATGLLSAMGHNPTIGIRNFTGEVNFNPDTLEGSGLRVSIQTASLSVQDDLSDKDRREIERLMNEQVLETARYPQVAYEASTFSGKKMGDALYSADIDGDLSLHGVTRSETVTARVAAYGEMLRCSGDFNLKQSDYQIKPVSFVGGALKLKDELKFSFEMVVRKQA